MGDDNRKPGEGAPEMTEYEEFCRFHAAIVGQIVPGIGKNPTPFTEACIGRAIAVLEQYFPEDANVLRKGGICPTMAHSQNGWMTRPMGRMIRLVEKHWSRRRWLAEP